MLSESAAVAPLRPVPVGVDSSLLLLLLLFDCDDEWGMFKKVRFLSGPAAPSPCCDVFEAVLRRSSVDGGPRDDERGGGIMAALEPGAGLVCRVAEAALLV